MHALILNAVLLLNGHEVTNPFPEHHTTYQIRPDYGLGGKRQWQGMDMYQLRTTEWKEDRYVSTWREFGVKWSKEAQ